MSARSDVRAGGSGWPLVLAVAGVLLVADGLTKWFVQETLRLGESVRLAGDVLRLTYVLNEGAAFGVHVGPHSRVFFTVVALVAIAVLVQVVRRTPVADRAQLAALALVLGGAAGNLADRLRAHGAVVDFLDVGFGAFRWPVFNLADVGITTGAFLLVALLWSAEEEDAPEAAPAALPDLAS